MLNVNFTPFPVLTTERLILRPIDENDVNEMFFLRSDEATMKYICKPKPKDNDDILQLIQKIKTMITENQGVSWAISLKGDPKLVGHISFHVLMKEHYRAEVGYMLHPALWGKGLTDEALKAVLDYGFNTMGLHSVEAIASPENTASRQLLEKNNFKLEGHFKEDFFWEGEFLDSVVYSLLTPGK